MCTAVLASLAAVVHGLACTPSVSAFPRRLGSFELECFWKAVSASMGVASKDDRFDTGEGQYCVFIYKRTVFLM